MYARGYRSRGIPRKRGRRDMDDDVGTAGNPSVHMNSAHTTSNGRSGSRGGGRPRPSVAGMASAAGGGGGGALDGDRASQSLSGTVEVRLSFTGRRYLRLRLDNYPRDTSERGPTAVKPEIIVSGKDTLATTTEKSERPMAADASAGSEKKCIAKALEVKEKALIVRTEASGVGTISAVSDNSADSAAVTTLEEGISNVLSAKPAAEQKASLTPVVSSVLASENSASGGPRVGMKIFTPIPLAGPKPAVARGGWASLAASTAASTGVSEAGGGKAEGGQLGLAGTWVNRPLSVLHSLRSLLVSRSPVPEKAFDGDGEPEESALVCLLKDGVRETQPLPFGEDCDCDYGLELRRDPLEQLVGKMRLLLQADLSNKGVGSGDVAVSQMKLGLGEFISLLEDVHRSVERTTRQRCVFCCSCMEKGFFVFVLDSGCSCFLSTKVGMTSLLKNTNMV